MFQWKPESRRLLPAVILLISVALNQSCTKRETPSTAPQVSETENQIAHSEIDRALSRAASEALKDREGTVLVMDPQSGRIRAVANPRLAFEQAFPPGSTIKSFTAWTAMRSGLIDRETRTKCEGKFSSDSIDVVCSHPKSGTPFNLAQALGYSCNYFFAKMAGKLSYEAFKSNLAVAGFGARTGINAAESAGTLKDGDWSVRDLLGEGDNLLVTPIQLLTAYCALMNGGHLFRPGISNAPDFSPQERAALHVDSEQRIELLRGMRGAVVYGTAAKAELNKLPLFIVGKTGTSTASNEFRRQGWFVSFASSAHSVEDAEPKSLQLAVLVMLKRSHGSEAALVSRHVYEEYAKITGAVAGDSSGQRDAPEATASNQRGPQVRVKVLSENRVEQLSLEDYVEGVLAVEATLEDESEALKAQAVVTRTYAIKNLRRHSSEGFDLCSNTHCQQYTTDRNRVSQKIHDAVVATSGEVLRDRTAQLADAYFHASCGGMTANIGSLWGVPAPAYLRGVRDDYCASMPNHEWTDEIQSTDLLRALRSDPRTDSGRILRDVIVNKRDMTGRAESILIEGERRRQVSGWEFKIIVGRELGWNLLKSSRFDVSRHGSTFLFRGSGFGHGLGLCQSGAHVMARRGASFEQILDQYFPTTRLVEGLSASTQSRYDDKLTGASGIVLPCALEFSFQSPRKQRFRISAPAIISQSEIEAVRRALEAARLDLLARAGDFVNTVADEIEVVVHATSADYIASTSESWWTAGVTHGKKIELQPLLVLRRRRILNSTLRHEYVHAVIEMAARGKTPRWLAEGLAIEFANEGPALARYRPKRRLSQDELERRLSIPRSPAEMRMLYAAADIEVRMLIQKEGEREVWRRIWSAAPTAALLCRDGKHSRCVMSQSAAAGGALQRSSC